MMLLVWFFELKYPTCLFIEFFPHYVFVLFYFLFMILFYFFLKLFSIMITHPCFILLILYQMIFYFFYFCTKESLYVDGLDLFFRFCIYPYIDMKGETSILILGHLMKFLDPLPSF